MSEILNTAYLTFLKRSGVTTFLQNKPNNFYALGANKKIPLISDKIEDISDINELELFINKYSHCNLKQHAKKTVMGNGNTKAEIMLIGEAPGVEEDKIGKPFVGAAGQLLNKMLAAIKLERDDVYITNILPWRPPNNRTPSNEEILQCLPFVQRHIELVNPKFILLLGSTATKAILSTSLSIAKLRGNWHDYKSLNLNRTIQCLATYHPAFLLRSPNYKKQSWEDLQILQQKILDENL